MSYNLRMRIRMQYVHYALQSKAAKKRDNNNKRWWVRIKPAFFLFIIINTKVVGSVYTCIAEYKTDDSSINS